MNSILSHMVEGLVALAVYLLASVITYPLRRQVAEEVHRADETGGRRAVLRYCSRPVVVLGLTAGLVWAMKALWYEGAGWVDSRQVLVRGWLTFWEVLLIYNLIEGAARQFTAWRGMRFPVPRLIASLMRLAVLGAAVFCILRLQFGFDIAPLLASTALITAVVGFALQGVLGNLLSGMSLHIVRSVMPSDWISVSGFEGRVVETNWRETRLCTTGGHTLIVPNSTMASSVVNNMSRPNAVRRHSFFVGASYEDAPAEVIDALVESASSVPAVMKEPPPAAFLVEYKDFGINYELRYWTDRYQERVSIDGEVGRRIWYQFKRRGIEIPFPMSDKLLTDFMEVVAQQRRMPPETEQVEGTLTDLMRSDLVCRFLADKEGQLLLGREEMSVVAPFVRRLRYTRGETVFRQGDPGESCYVIVSGTVRGKIEYSSRQAFEFELGPGALFGEMSLMAGLPRTATIATAGEMELLEIRQDGFAKLLSLRPEVPEQLARIVAERGAVNAEAMAKARAMEGVNIEEALQSGSLLKRFMRLVGLNQKKTGA